MHHNRARHAISLVDLTNLDDDCDAAAVAMLCERAATHGTAAVCVWPDFVAGASAHLAGTDVAVATVVNFPTGDERAFSVAGQTERAIRNGADEIDVVLPYRHFGTESARPSEVLRAVRDATTDAAVMKVILETGELADLETVERAARFAIDHGADFIKTSTGKTPVSATPEAAATMLDAIAATERAVGLKPSGGIRSADDADRYLRLAESKMGPTWVTPATFRFGASGLLDALLAVIDGRAAGPSDATY